MGIKWLISRAAGQLRQPATNPLFLPLSLSGNNNPKIRKKSWKRRKKRSSRTISLKKSSTRIIKAVGRMRMTRRIKPRILKLRMRSPFRMKRKKTRTQIQKMWLTRTKMICLKVRSRSNTSTRIPLTKWTRSHSTLNPNLTTSRDSTKCRSKKGNSNCKMMTTPS